MSYYVLSTLSGKTITSISQILKQGFTGTSDGKATTGAVLKVNDVYSISQGGVVDVGIDPGTNLYAVTVQYRADKWFKYCNLSSVSVSVNQRLRPKDKIGIANRGELRFEYCNLTTSRYINRIANMTTYKQDPMVILSGTEPLETTSDTFYVESDERITTTRMITNYTENHLASIMNNTGR